MLTVIFTFLKNIKLKYWLLLIIVILAIALTHYRTAAIEEKAAKELSLENFSEILKLQKNTDSMQVVHLQFKQATEIETYIKKTTDLKALLKKQGFEKPKDYKKINEMLFASQKYIDTTIYSFKASSLISSIQNNTRGIVEFSKKGKCISFDGSVEFNNGNLTINTFNEKYTDKILVTNSKGRRTKKILFFRVGPRKDEFTVTANCADVSVQFIEKVK